MKPLTSFVTQFRWYILIVAVASAIGWAPYGAAVIKTLTGGGILADDAESYRVESIMTKDFAASNPSLILLLTDQSRLVDDPTFAADAAKVEQKAGEVDGVTVIGSYYTTKQEKLVSVDRHSTYVPLSLSGSEAEQKELFWVVRDAVQNTGLSVQITGSIAARAELLNQIETDLRHAEVISFIILSVLLLFVFRSVAAAAMPLLTGGISIVLGLSLIRWIGEYMMISAFAVNVISLLGLGLAIDYSLFIISRFREELGRGLDRTAALEATLASAGRTVMFSGLIVMISLAGLLVFSAPFMKSVGLGGAIAVAVSALVSIVVLPAVLAILGPKVEWGRLGKIKPEAEKGAWWRLSHFVVRYASLILVVVLGGLIWLGQPFLSVKLGLSDATSLPASAESRRASETLKSSFSGLDVDPIYMTVSYSSPLDATNTGDLTSFIQSLSSESGVTRVDSLLGAQVLPAPYRAAYLAGYVQGNTTMIRITPQNKDDKALVRRLRALPKPAGSEVLVGGQAANIVDLLDEIKSGLPAALGILLITTFVVLLFMLGSILVPLKAVLLNALSLSASFGIITWIFQYGHFEKLLHFTSNGTIEAALPVIIFAIAFGLAMDYEVFLVSRIKERVDAGDKTTDAVAYGLQKTGSIITSAALLLLVVIGSFTAGETMTIKQAGMGLGLAVFIDAVFVRSLLVPATMYFLGEYNWWLPKWLRWIVNKVGLAH